MYIIQHSEIKGDQSVGKFKDCFKIIYFDYEAGRSTHQALIGSNERHWGSIKCSPIQIVKYVCTASRALQESCHFGKPSECKILFLDSSNTEYLEITLTDALFSNYKFQAHGGTPRETFDITFTPLLPDIPQKMLKDCLELHLVPLLTLQKIQSNRYELFRQTACG